jgi:hypothetical protein
VTQNPATTTPRRLPVRVKVRMRDIYCPGCRVEYNRIEQDPSREQPFARSHAATCPDLRRANHANGAQACVRCSGEDIRRLFGLAFFGDTCTSCGGRGWVVIA